ncbi:ImmA/IrrE family metallo-endopeptidase [Aerosticca soli]|uniref:ImmA/IrrE family metallo-endopeptidase n=1 Tax=Aerosticca soli TaxID=2010829 RepID=UPI0018E06F1F|nr:ImmA/IrrE family metallo-endopeptidase [Aerosticca soli]
MGTACHLTGSIAASHVHKWLRAWYGADVPEAIDLDVVRQMLPTTPYGKGVREIRPPVQFNDDAFEGMLARDPGDPEVWGIAYNGTVSPQRQRFTIAHELGHFILHRDRQQRFNCDKESVYSGHETMRLIEREADDFASNLLMPGDRLREWISNGRIDLHVLSAIAKRFQVSFGAVHLLHQVHLAARHPGLLGQRLREVRMAQQQRRQDAGAHPTHRRSARAVTRHARRRRERRAGVGRHRDVCCDLVSGGGTLHEAA